MSLFSLRAHHVLLMLVPLLGGCVSIWSEKKESGQYSFAQSSSVQISYTDGETTTSSETSYFSNPLLKNLSAALDKQNYPVQLFAWNGRDKISINVPANIRFQYDENPLLEIRAPEKLLKVTRVEEGTISWLPGTYKSKGAIPFILIIRGPKMPQLFVRNAADISLENLKQEKLDVEMLALGDLRATGEVQNLELKLNGSARADLTGLKVKDIRADARGNSRAFLRGHGAVNIAIADLAAVSLYERPASLKTTIDTFGRFYQKF